MEAGLLLAVAPWTPLWRRNFFAGEFPWVRGLMGMTAVQGVVIAAGLLTAIAGIIEIRGLFGRRLPSAIPPTDMPR